jgi:hypothetical protein
MGAQTFRYEYIDLANQKPRMSMRGFSEAYDSGIGNTGNTHYKAADGIGGEASNNKV